MIFQSGLLQWVVVENELCHVSQFAHLTPKLRPAAFCPVCERQVVMKLGKLKTHHAAHSPDSSCALTNPETAVHFNTKMHIARQLEKASQKELHIPHECWSCSAENSLLWVQNWDDVKVERKLENKLQPDILLAAQGSPLAAIEIFVTHSVNDDKAVKLEAIGLPWVEIKGKPEIYTGDNTWYIEMPLPVFRTDYIFDERWLCKECLAQKIQAEERQEWAKINGEKWLRYKIVDFFYPSGQWMRNLFTIAVTLEDGKEVKFTLIREKTSLNFDRIKYFDEDAQIIATVNAPTQRAEAIKQLEERGRSYLRKVKENGAILDSPMPWIEKEPASFELYNLRNFPRRYLFTKKTNQWFVPKDRKTIFWFDEEGKPSRPIIYSHDGHGPGYKL